jgi:RimJ/RimL family protein N-acetyltransferase
MVIKIKNKIFEISKLRLKSINQKYVDKLQNNFLDKKVSTIKEQKKYVREIRLKKNEIFQITNNDKLIATSGFNFFRSKLFQGIFIFDKNFLGKGYAKYFILAAAIHSKKTFKKNLIYAGILDDNLKSKKSFLKSGFKPFSKNPKSFRYKNKKSMIYLLNLNSINIKLISKIKFIRE